MSKKCSYNIADLTMLLTAIQGVVLLTLFALLIMSNISAESNRQSNLQTYKALQYKSQVEETRDEFGLLNKEYLDEIQHWNEEIARHKTLSANPFVSWFYPTKVYEGMDIIEIFDISGGK